ncbi:MAG: hypothetical protein ABR985_15400 [Methanotrichaceae archaeon]|jgi:hypothetical protein
MLTENRRKYLETRNLDKGKKAEYDYRVLKWLETMLNPGKEGGIGDLNLALDTLDREAIHKHLKDENVDDLLKVVERLLEILDFVPVGHNDKGLEFVSKSIIVAPKNGGELTVLSRVRSVTAKDKARAKMLKDHIEHLKLFVEETSAGHLPDPRSPEYYTEMIDSAHKQGYVVMAYDKKPEGKEEPK